MELVTLEHKILKTKRKYIPDRGIEPHHRQRIRLTAQLQFRLLQMVVVQMHIPEGVNKLSRCQITNLRHHQRQQGITGDIERDPEEHIRTALIQLTAQPPIRDIELEQRMTRHQRHLGQISYIPCADDQPPAVRCLSDRSEEHTSELQS